MVGERGVCVWIAVLGFEFGVVPYPVCEFLWNDADMRVSCFGVFFPNVNECVFIVVVFPLIQWGFATDSGDSFSCVGLEVHYGFVFRVK